MSPPIVLYSDDDAEIKSLLVKHSQAAALEPRPDWPRDGFRIHTGWRDGIYYYVVTRYYGYPDEADNGYAMIAVAVPTCTVDELKSIVRTFLDYGRVEGGPVYYEEIFQAKNRN